MGNADSHSSLVSSSMPSCSLRFSSRREELVSPRSWWRSSKEGNHQSQHATGPTFASWHYEDVPEPPRGGSRRSSGSPQRFGRSSADSGGSPKVLLSKDGSMRVEFTNARVIPRETPSCTAAVTTPEPAQRTSKGSSLSSNGSWYDSPWGNGSELTDNVFVCGQSVDASSGYNTYSSTRTEQTTAFSPGFSPTLLFPTTEPATSYNTCSSGRTEDSGIGNSMILQPDLFSPPSYICRSHNVPAAFPTDPDTFSTDPDTSPPKQQRTASSSSAPVPADVKEEEEGSVRGVVRQYSSSTLPCRRTEPFSSTSVGNNRKDFLKSRIRQLSDWTGSLSRKKRRLQEPQGSETVDIFVNGLSSGTSSCSSLWSSNPLYPQKNCFPALHSGSSRSLNQNQSSSDTQRQNIYENFMQELETSCSAADQTEHSQGDGEDREGDEGDVDMDGEMEGGGRGGHLDEQGVVRRAGWLSFKALITVNKDRKIELVSRRKWRHYWVTLKGCTLLFYETYGRSTGGEQDLSPRYALLADDSIVQAIPEHPRREHVFCVSNAYGDVYLFQAANQTDLENWVTSIHSASAALLARRQGREDTLRLLHCQSRSLLHNIDMDAKMKKMAELQLSIIKEPKSRRAVEVQIQQWDQNLEKLNLDLFRFRCYLSSLQGGELPNPKSLLAVASRPSKGMLGRLGVFSVSSFHALVCSRDEDTLRRRCRTQSGGSGRRRGLPSSLKSLSRMDRQRQDGKRSHPQTADSCQSKQQEVAPPAGQPVVLQSDEPSGAAVFSLDVSRPNVNQDFGFAVTGHVDGLGQSHVFVSEVDPLGLLARAGLQAGDEVLAVNGGAVSGLDLELLQSLFRHQKLQLLLRRDESVGPKEPAGVWPNVRGLTHLHTWSTGSPLIPDPAEAPLPDVNDAMMILSEQLLEQNMDRVSSLYQTFPESRAPAADIPRNPYSKEGGLQPASPSHLSVCQRLRKVIQELVDTEKSYVKDLVCLFDIYLTPLQNETFLSKDEMEALFGSLPEMLNFQRVFLQTLEERIAACPNISSLETPEQFKKLLFSLGGSFLYYADHFKLYSGFCANHIKVQKVLERAKTDAAFKHFLETRNPTNQHSSSLESYLIKPVQRVLKYPLLLRELVSLTDAESPEHAHLTEALRAMEKVASHINEMQKIYEDYGCVFDQLASEQSGADRQVTEISMGEFLVHSSVVWLNPLPGLRRLRKEPELTLFVFKRAVILVYRESSKLKKRMAGPRPADLDPFRFRWLIPVSAVQVRAAGVTGSDDPCVWELVHSRSEVEGRPETVFQLCSSGLQTKSSVVAALHSLLRDQPSSMRSSRPSWRRKQQRFPSEPQSTPCLTQDNRRPNGLLAETCSEPLLPSRLGAPPGRRTRLCSLTSELEVQLQRLNFTEEWRGDTPHGEGEERKYHLRGEVEERRRGLGGEEEKGSHGLGGEGEERRRGLRGEEERSHGLRGKAEERRRGLGGEDEERRHGLGGEDEERRRGLRGKDAERRRGLGGELLDFGLLERDFSVHSMASMFNEDCFYDPVLGVQTLQGQS